MFGCSNFAAIHSYMNTSLCKYNRVVSIISRQWVMRVTLLLIQSSTHTRPQKKIKSAILPTNNIVFVWSWCHKHFKSSIAELRYSKNCLWHRIQVRHILNWCSVGSNLVRRRASEVARLTFDQRCLISLSLIVVVVVAVVSIKNNLQPILNNKHPSILSWTWWVQLWFCDPAARLKHFWIMVSVTRWGDLLDLGQLF